MFNPFRLSFYDEKNSFKESESLIADGQEEANGRGGIELQTSGKACVNKSKEFDHSNLRTWRLAAAFMGIFFLLAAIVQHNDPDPYIWMAAYGIPCVVSWMFACAGATTEIAKSGLRDSFATPSRANVKTFWPSWSQLLDILISGHIIYCFALGIWTLYCYAAMEEDRIVMHPSWGSESMGNEERETGENNMVRMNAEEAKELFGLCLIITWLSLLRNSNFIHLGQKGIYLAISLTITPFLAWILVEMYEQEALEC